MTQAELNERLEKLAYKRSEAFCYQCYQAAPAGRCEQCGSDDLMRSLRGVGCEYGVDWIIQHILSEELDAVDTEESFEASIRELYPETTTVGWLHVDTASAIKELDPVSWDLARSEWVDADWTEGNLASFDNGSTFYQRHEVEALLDDSETD